jgi:hypothetical protein
LVTRTDAEPRRDAAQQPANHYRPQQGSTLGQGDLGKGQVIADEIGVECADNDTSGDENHEDDDGK